jgi:AraC-like DNA-binding protein
MDDFDAFGGAQPHANIKGQVVAFLIARAGELGVPTDPWFAGLRLRRAQFDGAVPPPLSQREACEIVRRALRALPGEGHGLLLGERQGIGHFGVLGLAMMTAADFGAALRIGIEYAPITGAMMDLAMDDTVSDGVAVLARMREYGPDIEPFLCEELFASSLMLCRGLLGPGFRPLRLELRYPRPAYAEAYARTFGCDIHFGQPWNRVVIERSWLGFPMPVHNSLSAQQVLALCRAQMPALPAGNATAAAVERLLRARLADGPRLREVAAELHLTERTLRRHLHAAGTSFQALHDRLRSESAQALLRDPRMDIASVGLAIGFRDPREFRRAFRRWTGTTPRELRWRGADAQPSTRIASTSKAAPRGNAATPIVDRAG